jgi:hypothetical protein
MSKSPFELTSDQKKMIQDISSLCGVKQETVSQVWKYTLLMNYLTLLENRKTKNHMIQVPFIGKVWVHEREDGEIDVQPFFTESFSEMIKRVKSGDDTRLVKYFEEEFVDPILQEIEES